MATEKDVDDHGRLQVAEEAVRIVRRFNTMGKDKEDRQKKIIELCTDIAGILDAKRRYVHFTQSHSKCFVDGPDMIALFHFGNLALKTIKHKKL